MDKDEKRLHFAGHALSGLLASANPVTNGAGGDDEVQNKRLSLRAWRIADAMMNQYEERAKTKAELQSVKPPKTLLKMAEEAKAAKS
jgi:hypothetical protein